MQTKPNKIIAIIYRNNNDSVEFLALKKPKFWQFVSGNIDYQEIPLETVYREIGEEAGIDDPISIIDTEKLYNYRTTRGEVKTERLFLVEAKEDQKVNLSEEHSEYKLLSYSSFLHILRFTSNKDALAHAYHKILELSMRRSEKKVKLDN